MNRRMYLERVGSFASCLVFASAPAYAQADLATPAPSIDERVIQQQLRQEAVTNATTAANDAASLMSTGTPNDRTMAGFSRPSIDFTTEQGETSTSLAFSFELQDQQPDTSSQPGYFHVSQTRLSVVASIPIEEGGDLSQLFQGDSLVTGSKLTLSISNLSNRLGTGASGEGEESTGDLIGQAYKICIPRVVQNQSSQASLDEQTIADFNEDLNNRIVRYYGNYDLALEEISQSLAPYSSLAASVSHACVPGTGDYTDTVEFIKGELGQDISNRFYDKKTNLTFMGLDGTVGRDTYEFLDQGLFENTSADRTSWEFGGFFGIVNWNSTHSARVRAVYGKKWELPEEMEVCRTFADTMQEKCLTGPGGMPESKRTGLVSFESRHVFNLTETDRIAFSPQVTYRFEDDNVGVEVPVYLAPDKDGKLTGGIKFGYDSREDEFGIGLFIGVPFSTLF